LLILSVGKMIEQWAMRHFKRKGSEPSDRSV